MDRRQIGPESYEPEPEPNPPRWTWDGDTSGLDRTPFQLGSLAVALLFFGTGVLVLGYQLAAALLSR